MLTKESFVELIEIDKDNNVQERICTIVKDGDQVLSCSYARNIFASGQNYDAAEARTKLVIAALNK